MKRLLTTSLYARLKRRTVVLAIVAAGAATAIAALPSGASAAQGAGKVPLTTDFNFLGFCRGNDGAPVPPAGFAVINAPGDNSVSATVSLKAGAPNTAYLVHLVQVPSFSGCFVGQAQDTLVTNGQGNGTVHISVPLDAGTTSAWVYLEQAGFFAFTTQEVAIQ